MTAAFAAYRRWRGLDGRADTMVLASKFVWTAAAFGPLWALARGRWRAAAALGVGWTVAFALGMAAGPLGWGVIWLVAAVWAGATARELEALWLDDQDWRLEDLAVADNQVEAESRLIAADAARAPDVERRW